jgi:hypothetical protein
MFSHNENIQVASQRTRQQDHNVNVFHELDNFEKAHLFVLILELNLA